MPTLPPPPEEFNDSKYLGLHPDVHAAVGCGEFSSGWEHYLRHGFLEEREGIPPSVRRFVVGLAGFGSEDGLPPAFLRRRVHGSAERQAFAAVGRRAAKGLQAVVKSRDIELKKSSRLLDFGCGCGRVTRHLRKAIGPCRIFGCDIDADAICWCQTHLPSLATFSVNRPAPPAPYEDGFFDLVFSLSVFTHLPEPMQFEWLEELARVTHPGGYLFLSVRNDEVEPGDPHAREVFRTRGFSFEENIVEEEMPSFYQTAYHTEAYIREEWGRYLSVREILSDWVPGQALVIAER